MKTSDSLPDPLQEAISAFVGSIATGLVLTLPFYFVVSIETWNLFLCLWAIHAIMVHAYFEWKHAELNQRYLEG